MFYRAKTIHSKGPKDLAQNKIRTADLTGQRDIPYYMISSEGSSEGSGNSSVAIPLLTGLAKHQLGDGEHLLVHHLLCTFIHREKKNSHDHIFTNSFISTRKFFYYYYLCH